MYPSYTLCDILWESYMTGHEALKSSFLPNMIGSIADAMASLAIS